MEVNTGAAPEPKMNDQILFDRPNSMFVGRITKLTDKAVLVMYGIEPISAYSSSYLTIYTHECWIPKSVIIQDGNQSVSWTVKKWFSRSFSGGRKMRYNVFYNPDGKLVRA